MEKWSGCSCESHMWVASDAVAVMFGSERRRSQPLLKAAPEYHGSLVMRACAVMIFTDAWLINWIRTEAITPTSVLHPLRPGGVRHPGRARNFDQAEE